MERTMTEYQKHAIAEADAQLNNAALPTYSELVETLRRVDSYCDMYMPSNRLHGVPVVLMSSILSRIPVRGVVQATA
jgi:hypothetical protein